MVLSHSVNDYQNYIRTYGNHPFEIHKHLEESEKKKKKKKN